VSNELVINSTQNGCRIALLNDRRLIEFHQENGGNQFNVGDIYLGTVRKVVQGLNAGFIDIGYEKDAFLHYLDLGPQIQSLNKFTQLIQSKKEISTKLTGFRNEADIDKFGKIGQVLTKNQKNPCSGCKGTHINKGPEIIVRVVNSRTLFSFSTIFECS